MHPHLQIDSQADSDDFADRTAAPENSYQHFDKAFDRSRHHIRRDRSKLCRFSPLSRCFLVPLLILTAERESIATAAKIGEFLSDRVEYGDVIDQTLYQSADSYSQARLFYLQSRRNQLGYEFEGEDAFFEELYGSE